MKTIVQFLKRNESGNLEPIDGINQIKLIDENKTLNAQMIEGLELSAKHQQTDEIIGFNIIEIDFRQKETIIHQNIF